MKSTQTGMSPSPSHWALQELPTSQPEKRSLALSLSNSQSLFAPLPKEIAKKVLSKVVYQRNIRLLVRDVKRLSAVDKRFNTLIKEIFENKVLVKESLIKIFNILNYPYWRDIFVNKILQRHPTLLTDIAQEALADPQDLEKSSHFSSSLRWTASTGRSNDLKRLLNDKPLDIENFKDALREALRTQQLETSLLLLANQGVDPNSSQNANDRSDPDNLDFYGPIYQELLEIQLNSNSKLLSEEELKRIENCGRF